MVIWRMHISCVVLHGNRDKSHILIHLLVMDITIYGATQSDTTKDVLLKIVLN
jgi:hypothetical protein